MITKAPQERPLTSANGYAMVGLGVLLLLLALGAAISRFVASPLGTAVFVLLVLAALVAFIGLYTLQPNEAAIATLFGAYRGSDRSAGLRWANPLFVKRKISLRSRNFNAPTLKVNDKRGNPVEISAAVVWRVRDTAKALFEVEDYERYVGIQAETALRHLANLYNYDEGEDLGAHEVTLRGGMDEVGQAMKTELQARFEQAGVEVQDAKLTHLAYAPEIAQVMLRRQQAEAIISARAKIVRGAVTMVELALQALSEREIVVLDDERKAAMVSNLLVVLCSDKETQPIINAGTLYS